VYIHTTLSTKKSEVSIWDVYVFIFHVPPPHPIPLLTAPYFVLPRLLSKEKKTFLDELKGKICFAFIVVIFDFLKATSR